MYIYIYIYIHVYIYIYIHIYGTWAAYGCDARPVPFSNLKFRKLESGFRK